MKATLASRTDPGIDRGQTRKKQDQESNIPSNVAAKKGKRKTPLRAVHNPNAEEVTADEELKTSKTYRQKKQ